VQDVVFVVNPRAASGRAARVWAALRERAELRQARCIMADTPRQARERLLDALDAGSGAVVRRVIALGGDGTLNCVAGTLLASGHPAVLGLIPVGSGSDTARVLGLGRNPGLSLQRALQSEPRPMDALRYDPCEGGGRGWVINIASTGISGLVARDVDARVRRWPGTYLWTALKALRRFQPASCRIEIDDRPWYQGPVLLCAVANGSTFARGMRIAPHARCDDGMADVVLALPAPLPRILPWLPGLYTGTHLRAPFVRWARARHVRIQPLTPDQPLPFETDGEPLTAAGMDFTLVAGALRMAF